MKEKVSRTSRFFRSHADFWTVVACALMGAGVFFLLFGVEVLNPVDTRWVRFSGGDNFQHYIGWRFYRNAPWIRYLTFFRNLNYPLGSSTIVTDSNPLLSLLFKLFRAVLPRSFQYNGFWLLISFTLNGLFAGLIGVSLHWRSWLTLSFAAFVLSNPVPLQRALIHDTLAGHWLILAAIWILVSGDFGTVWVKWAVLFFLTLGIHFYFLPMVGYVFVLALLRMIRARVPACQLSLTVVASIVAVTVAFFFFGYSLVQPGTASYGELSLNLNAFWNPDGLGRFLPDLPTFPLQYEGFNYWGLGILAIALFGMVFGGRSDWRLFGWFALPTLVLVLVAASNVITFNQRVWLSIGLPESWLGMLSAIRSSGRLVWPLVYFATIWAFRSLSERFENTQRGRMIFAMIVIATLIFQVADLSDFYRSIRTRVSYTLQSQDSIQLDLDAWAEVCAGKTHLIVGDGRSDQENALALLAADRNMTFNGGANARAVQPVLGGDWVDVAAMIQSGTIADDTVLVLLTDAEKDEAARNYPELYREIDGLGVVAY